MLVRPTNVLCASYRDSLMKYADSLIVYDNCVENKLYRPNPYDARLVKNLTYDHLKCFS